MHQTLNEHYRYLADDVRLEAYRRALRHCITPDSVVIDLGCGTGILGLLACEAGARQVYAIDKSGMIEIARSVARNSPYADRIQHLRLWSEDAILPERADVVLADQMGPLGFDAGVVGNFADAAARLMKPSGHFLPGTLETWLAPLQHAEAWQRVGRWSELSTGFDLSSIRHRAANTSVPIKSGTETLLGEPARSFAFRLGEAEPPGKAVRSLVNSTVSRDGTLHGLLGWFVAGFAAGAAFCNGPSPIPRIQRPSLMLPIDPMVDVREGDVVQTELSAGLPNRFLAWRVTVLRKGEPIARREHATLRGLPLSAEDFPDSAPVVSD